MQVTTNPVHPDRIGRKKAVWSQSHAHRMGSPAPNRSLTVNLRQNHHDPPIDIQRLTLTQRNQPGPVPSSMAEDRESLKARFERQRYPGITPTIRPFRVGWALMEQQDIRGVIGHRFQCGQKIVLDSPLVAIWIAHDTADATDVQAA